MNSFYIRIALVALSVLLLIGAYNKGHQSGYDAKVAEYQEDYEAAVKLKTEEYIKAVHKIKKIAADDLTAALNRDNIVKAVETKNIEVIKYVDRKIKVPAECGDLINNINRVFIDATSNVTDATTATSTHQPIFTNRMR